MMKMGVQNVVMVVVVVLCLCVLEKSVLAAPVDQCNDEISKVGLCLAYVTGKSDKPAKECCDTIKDIKDKKPVCLCLVIQQTRKGQSQMKQLGVQEQRLLALPGACDLANTSASSCPKLLGLPPGSHDSDIFTNPSTNATSSSTSSKTPSVPKDDGFALGPSCSTVILLIISIFHFMFPM